MGAVRLLLGKLAFSGEQFAVWRGWERPTFLSASRGIWRAGLLWMCLLALGASALGQQPRFKAIAFYTKTVEPDHVHFANDAIKFYGKVAAKHGFEFDTTTDWENLNDAFLRKYQVVIWLNEFPHNAHERAAFERYMGGGGAWLGFHVAGYNDKDTGWPWFVEFMGGAIFYTNNWPPLPAALIVDDTKHPVTRHMPAKYDAPANEWYMWKPSPRLNPEVKVLVTLDPSNYPLGKKDLLTEGDIPVVWTNTRYRMLYMNMGHGSKIFDSNLQNRMFIDALLWLGTGAK
jgi:type 1 glutamine amidotransferase